MLDQYGYQHQSLLARLSGQRRFQHLAIFLATVLALLGAFAYLRPDIHGTAALYAGNKVSHIEKILNPPEGEKGTGWPIPTDSKYAFITLLSADKESGTDGEDVNEDHYYVNARVLTYQLCHAPGTKSKIPFVILVTPEVDHRKREQLERDGAIVWEVETVTPGLLHPTLERWEDTLTKLRLWEFTQFDLVAFIDADMFIFRNIDNIFDDPAVKPRKTLKYGKQLVQEGILPREYVFAGYAEQTLDHNFPPTKIGVENDIIFPWYFNTGLFITRPDPVLFAYYLSLTHAPKGKPQEPSSLPFDSSLPDQNLLNYAHRWALIPPGTKNQPLGSMPWTQIDPKWVVHHTKVNDLYGGAYAAHVHYWDPVHMDIQPYLMAKIGEMEAFYAARDELEAQGEVDWEQRAHEQGM